MKIIKGILLVGVILLLVGFVVIQFVPYGRSHTNPPVVREPNWDSPQTVALLDRACTDCHSNKTVWPWYSNIAPMSWLIQRDVEEGRQRLNFSEWGSRREGEEGEEMAEVIREGEMPPAQYLPLHPTARLTDGEKEQLIQGIIASIGQNE